MKNKRSPVAIAGGVGIAVLALLLWVQKILEGAARRLGGWVADRPERMKPRQ